MFKGIEFSGRLARRDGRPANPGVYALRFALHSDTKTRRSSWTEDHQEVIVSPGGFYSVVLGGETPLKATHFKSVPRWLSVRVLRRGEVVDESGPRTPLLGASICMAEQIERLGVQLSKLEGICEELRERPSTVDQDARMRQIEGRVGRVLEQGLPRIERSFRTLARRVESLDGEDGRLDRFEDRLDDLDGPDGDVLDVNDRIDSLESELRAVRDARGDEVSAGS